MIIHGKLYKKYELIALKLAYILRKLYIESLHIHR